MLTEGMECWEDSTTGCICGNECEPPQRIRDQWAAEERRAVWPPPRANRETRRHCEHLVKAGYCALCGEKIKP
jgi:hypothetical protein